MLTRAFSVSTLIPVPSWATADISALILAGLGLLGLIGTVRRCQGETQRRPPSPPIIHPAWFWQFRAVSIPVAGQIAATR